MVKITRLTAHVVGPTGRPANVTQGGRRVCNDCGGAISPQDYSVTCAVTGFRGRRTYCMGCVEVEANLLVDDVRSRDDCIGVRFLEDAYDKLSNYHWDNLYVDPILDSGGAACWQETGLMLIEWMKNEVTGGNLKIMPKNIVAYSTNHIRKTELEAAIADLVAIYEAQRSRLSQLEPESTLDWWND